VADNNLTTPAAGGSATGVLRAGANYQQGFDLQRFGQEVANEIGVDPANLGSYGLSEQRIRQYEAQTHSGTQNGGNR
jgi:hypothetical protein